MVVINFVVYYFGYCRNVAPPPPSSRRLCFHRRPARCAVESVLLILATGIDPIDRPQPAVFIFIGIVDSTEKKKTPRNCNNSHIPRQCTSRVLVLEIPNSPAISTIIMHISDLWKQRCRIAAERRRDRCIPWFIACIYAPFSIARHHVQRVYIGNYYIRNYYKRGCINAETLLWIDKNWIEEKRRALFSLRILLYLFRLNSRETRFGIVITLQRKFPYRSYTSEGTKIRSTGEAGWEQAYIKSEGDRRWFMGADALVVWHSVYRGRRWSKRWRVLATDSSKWRSLHSVYDSLFFVSRN